MYPADWIVTCDRSDHEHHSLEEARECAFNEYRLEMADKNVRVMPDGTELPSD